jgi:ribosomal protein L22
MSEERRNREGEPETVSPDEAPALTPSAESEQPEGDAPADTESPAPDAPGVTESERAEDTPGEQVSEPEPGPESPEPPATGEPGAAAAPPYPAAPPRRRRGASEVTTAPRRAGRPTGARPAGEAVEVRATAKYVRTAPRKARLVVDHIRGKSVDEAVAVLTHTPRGAAEDVLKLLRSCVANAENNHGFDADELRIARAYVDEGPTLKRFRPRAQGRATRIRKRTSHMTITLVPKE